MAIEEEKVRVKITSRNSKHYKDQGYILETYLDKNGIERVKLNLEIYVKVEDLSKNSHMKLTKICDICGEKVVPKQRFVCIMSSRKSNGTGIDICKLCSTKNKGIQRGIANETNCINTIDPEFAKLFWNIEETFKYKCQSNKKADFKCPNCGEKIPNKKISNVFNFGLSCICKDGLFYPEKFMYEFLKQLKSNFKYHEIFEWSKNIEHENPNLSGMKIYDFYLEEKNMIIETHGGQHSKRSFEKLGARTLEEEQENDKIKKSIAIENGIINYIEIDSRKSTLEFMKNSIIKKLGKFFDLNKIDWLKCHKFACGSRIVEACNLRNEGNNAKQISDILELDRTTVIDYLKKGNELSLCNYDAKEEIRKNNKTNGGKNKKSVIQFSLEGKYMHEWESAREIERVLGINYKYISKACNGYRKTVENFIWMFKEDYEKQLKFKPLKQS